MRRVVALPGSSDLRPSSPSRLQVCTVHLFDCIAAGTAWPGAIAFHLPRDTDVAGSFGGHVEVVELWFLNGGGVGGAFSVGRRLDLPLDCPASIGLELDTLDLGKWKPMA